MNRYKPIVRLRGKNYHGTGCVICGDPKAKSYIVHELQLLSRQSTGSVYDIQGRRTTSHYKWIRSITEALCNACILTQSLLLFLIGIVILLVPILLFLLIYSWNSQLFESTNAVGISATSGFVAFVGFSEFIRRGFIQLIGKNRGDVLLKYLYESNSSSWIIVTRDQWENMKS